MEAQIKRWGNSLALRIPKLVARRLALEVDTPVGLSCEGDALTIRPLKVACASATCLSRFPTPTGTGRSRPVRPSARKHGEPCPVDAEAG